MTQKKNLLDRQLNYKDIALKPKQCIVDSRNQCDTSVKIGDRVFNMPVYPANMKSVVDVETCKYLAKNNWFYTMHRFGVDIFDFVLEMQKEGLFTSISVGVNEDSYKVLYDIYNEPLEVDYITIDVANAWSEKCKKMVSHIKYKFPESFLIVGNVATSEAYDAINGWGADAVKVGIAGGSVCITRNKTGVFRPMVSALRDCYITKELIGLAEGKKPAMIIADGGIVEHGDIAKAIASGADMVMAGSLFSGYDQSAGNVIEIEDRMYKEYYGSASQYNKGEYRNVEGKKTLIQYKGDMDKLLVELKQDLQSAISYAGASDLEGLKQAEFYIV